MAYNHTCQASSPFEFFSPRNQPGHLLSLSLNFLSLPLALSTFLFLLNSRRIRTSSASRATTVPSHPLFFAVLGNFLKRLAICSPPASHPPSRNVLSAVLLQRPPRSPSCIDLLSNLFNFPRDSSDCSCSFSLSLSLSLSRTIPSVLSNFCVVCLSAFSPSPVPFPLPVFFLHFPLLRFHRSTTFLFTVHQRT